MKKKGEHLTRLELRVLIQKRLSRVKKGLMKGGFLSGDLVSLDQNEASEKGNRINRSE